jgi:hypothetical protein
MCIKGFKQMWENFLMCCVCVFFIVSFFLVCFVFVYRNPSLGFMTKARGCKIVGQKGSSGVMSHVPKSARECEGIDPRTPKRTPTLGVGVSVESQPLKVRNRLDLLACRWYATYR